MDNTLVNKAADNIRIICAAMVEEAKSGHPGGAMGGADFMNILYSEFLNFDPSDNEWFFRDRFFLDPGHMSPLLYTQLSLFGNYTTEELKNFRQWESPTPGHPEIDLKRGVENTSGPLGQGHVFAVGAAIAERFLASRFGEWTSHKIYTFISDGGIQEEIAQGAGRIAGYLGLSNLVMFYDSNDIQLSTEVKEVSCEDTAKKYEAWNWRVITVKGNDSGEIRQALREAVKETQCPVLIIGNTIMGKGAIGENGESFEGKTSTHGQPLSKAGASFAKTVENLGGDPENPFAVFPDVQEYYNRIKTEKQQYASQRKSEQEEWERNNPEAAAKLKRFISGDVPEIDFSKIIQKPDIATRAASSAVLGYFAENIENMIVASADLSNSDKTDGFLKKSKAFSKGDFSGAFLHAGVSELTMAAIANGMALHGGVVPVCGTFLVFSDYMKPSIRLAALMELPVKYVFTHDAFRVGEDGPTHQPVEHEAQLRLLEKMKNHSGNTALLALRPADAEETTAAWKIALNNQKSPTALILSRQAIKSLPVAGASRAKEALQAEKGAYIVMENDPHPDVILLANGSEVATLVEAANILIRKQNMKIRVVSVISEGLFRQQEISYQQYILPEDIPAFGLTAGLPVNLIELAGKSGTVFGLEQFGYSAPAGVLDQKFGFTAENVINRIMEMLNRQ